ncbi:Cubilin [Nymphon striatum]|nr:Cubilin [Nymphon striatum]
MSITQRLGTCSSFTFPHQRSTVFPPALPGGGECGQTYSSETFFLRSPGFQTASYFNNQDCEYKIKKVANDVCALELTFHKFDIQKSDDCLSDYFEVDGVKNCGVIDYDSVRTYRFTRDTEILKFHSDFAVTASGFFISGKQLRC